MQPGCNPVATVLKCCNRVAAGRCGRGAKVWRPGGIGAKSAKFSRTETATRVRERGARHCSGMLPKVE
jgi:hypothetical protein